jgi:hypothetical protein
MEAPMDTTTAPAPWEPTVAEEAARDRAWFDHDQDDDPEPD